MEEEAAFCPASEAIQLLQEKWVLLIVRELLSAPKGFNELSRSVGGCNPATLSHRMETLIDRGIVTKTVESVMPPKTLYALTPAGRALDEVIGAIDGWARRYLAEGPDRKARCRQQA